jgi:hypothetical protein
MPDELPNPFNYGLGSDYLGAVRATMTDVQFHEAQISGYMGWALDRWGDVNGLQKLQAATAEVNANQLRDYIQAQIKSQWQADYDAISIANGQAENAVRNAVLGGFQAIGGVAEVVTSALAEEATCGLSTIGLFDGIDNIVTGFNAMDGTPTDTIKSRYLQAIGVPQGAANYTSAGASVVINLGVAFGPSFVPTVGGMRAAAPNAPGIQAGPNPIPPAIPRAPDVAPGPGWKWTGQPPPGGPNGAWVGPDGDSLHPDLNHPPGKPPHWDWTDKWGNQWEFDPATGKWRPKPNHANNPNKPQPLFPPGTLQAAEVAVVGAGCAYLIYTFLAEYGWTVVFAF